MATRMQLARLSQRIEALAARSRAPAGGVTTFIVGVGECESAARERHYLAHPQHRDRREIIIQIVEPKV